MPSVEPIPSSHALCSLPRHQQQPNCSSSSKCLLRGWFFTLLRTCSTGSLEFSEIFFPFNNFSHLSIFDILAKAASFMLLWRLKFSSKPSIGVWRKVHRSYSWSYSMYFWWVWKDVLGAATPCWVCLDEFSKDWALFYYVSHQQNLL